jgi:hypothetical protein
MQAFHSDRFEPDSPTGHRFPLDKYWLLREAVARQLPDVRQAEALSVPRESLCLVPDPGCVAGWLWGDM